MNKFTSNKSELIQVLQKIDTPTICNAIEALRNKRDLEGFLGMGIRCLLPKLGTMVGYAVTATVDSSTPDIPKDKEVWFDWTKAMEASPKPSVLVFKDVGPQPLKSAHFGEVMGTIAVRLGTVGIITDGGIRDIDELFDLGFHCFAAGLVPSHGNPRILTVNAPVTIDGVTIHPGDLLHGDVNGVTTIPAELASRIPDAVEKIQQSEKEFIEFVKGKEFSMEGLYERKVSH
jgi:regulator of RNase E activity RraA